MKLGFWREFETFRQTQRAILLLVLLPSLTVRSACAAPITSNMLTLDDRVSSSSLSSLPYSNPDAPKGGEFSTYELGTFDSLNPLINTGTPVNGTAYLFDSLLSSSLNEPSVSYGLLADQITRDPHDSSWIIFHLNPKAYFSNHQPVTADDVVFTFNTILSKGSPGLRLYYSNIQKITALDRQTVRFDFKHDPVTKTNIKLAFAVGQMSIFSRQDWKKRPFDQVSMVAPLGSGPYLLDKIDSGRSITYRRNPDYWARDLMINRGKYNFDRIKYIYYRDPEVAFQGFKMGQYTFRAEKTSQNDAKNDHFSVMQQGLVTQETIPNKNPITMNGLVFNLRQDNFHDRRVRKAFTEAFDFEWLNKALLNHRYTRLQSYFFNSDLEAKGTPSIEEMAYLTPLLPQFSLDEKNEILNAWLAPTSNGDGFNRDNLLNARQLLLNAGYRYKNGQLVDVQGKIYSIEILCKDANLQRILLPYVRNLKRLGVNATIRLVDTPQYIERVRRFDYDMIVDEFPQTLTPNQEQIGYWGSQSANRQGSLNTAGIQNSAIDQLLNNLMNARDRTAVITITHALDRVLRAEYYMVPLYGLVGNRVMYWNQYRHPNITPNYDLGLDYWWIDSASAKRINQYIGHP
ncbi:MAG: ABC transporter substrate-binding protein [Gammaproteobacteria bacterium]|nr:ABC transporter substrate-binding protein [Gammaproteobacteria bacterium]